MSVSVEDRESLKDLLQSRGWMLYRDMVMEEITANFEEHITRALDVQDATVALDRMRQIAAVRKAGLRWLQLPKERLEALAREADEAIRHQERLSVVGRRPVGL